MMEFPPLQRHLADSQPAVYMSPRYDRDPSGSGLMLPHPSSFTSPLAARQLFSTNLAQGGSLSYGTFPVVGLIQAMKPSPAEEHNNT